MAVSEKSLSNLIPAKKGDIRNPNGKPKGTLHINTHIQNLLGREDFEAILLDPKGGVKQFKGTPLEAILHVVLHKAVNGDQKMIEMLMKYGWSQKVEQENTGEMTINVITRGSGTQSKE